MATAVGYDWWHRSRGGPNRFQLLSQREMFDQVSRHGSEVGGYIWNKAFSRDALTAGNIRYDEQLRIAEDYYFTADFVAHTPGKYAYNPTILYTKVNRPNSTMHNFSWADRRQEDQIFERIHRMRQLIQYARLMKTFVGHAFFCSSYLICSTTSISISFTES